jgi:thiol reductant ABC exporter CydC subunit
VSSLRRLVALAAPVRGWVVLATLSSCAALGANVALMTAAPYLISRAALVTGFAPLALSVTAVRAFAISRAAFRYVERYTLHLAALRILTHLRVAFYRAVEPLAPAGLDPHRTGDLLARAVADVDTLDDFFVRGVVPPVAAVLAVLLSAAIVGTIASPVIAVVLMWGLAVVGVAVPLVTRRASRRPAADVVRTRASLHAELADDVAGLADLLAFGAGSGLGSRLRDGSRRIGDGLRRLAFVRGAGIAAGAALSGLVGLALLALAIPLVRAGELHGVFLAAVPLVAFAAFEAVQPLGEAFGTIELSRAAAVRTFEVIDAPPVVADPVSPLPRPREPSVGFRDVAFRYGSGGPPVLDGLSFALPPGERLGIAGPSGSGKTTIVALLLRFWEPSAGTVHVGGLDVRVLRADDVRSMIGVVPQKIHLFNGSLRDNLLLADGFADDGRIAEGMTRARLGEFLTALPAGLDTRVGEDGLKLSGGERQRLALARVFLKDAPILILDEATSHLDADTEAEVLEATDAFARDKTVLVISHRPEPMHLAERVLTLPARSPAPSRSGNDEVRGATAAEEV